MSTRELAAKIRYWTETYSFCNVVEVKDSKGDISVEFEARTTTTRASSMVTRIGLIAQEVLGTVEYKVGKELIGEPPRDRAALASWRIFVSIAKRRSVAA